MLMENHKRTWGKKEEVIIISFLHNQWHSQHYGEQCQQRWKLYIFTNLFLSFVRNNILLH